MKHLIILSILFFLPKVFFAQKNKESVQNSTLLGIQLPSEAIQDNTIFGIAAAKTVLEMKSQPENVMVTQTEALTHSIQSGNKAESGKWIEGVKTSLQKENFDIIPCSDDRAYSWIRKSNLSFLMYESATKKEAMIYIGQLDRLPNSISNLSQTLEVTQNASVSSDGKPSATSFQTQSNKNSQGSPVNTTITTKNELVGNWGNITGAKIYWQDESTNYVTSGVDKGSGLELKSDGTFLQTTLVTSGRPNYRVFVSTTGIWSAKNSQLIMTPDDRHYRKWENEIIMVDEHSVPEPYIVYWMKKKNENTGKDCLYVKYDMGQSEWNELCQNDL